jgi:hypothetical protein
LRDTFEGEQNSQGRNHWKGNLLSNACRVDQNIRSTIFLKNSSHATLYSTSITDINLEEVNGDGVAGLFVKFSGRDVAELLISIKEHHIAGTGLNACLSN